MMRHATAVFGAAAIVLASVGAFAQAKPSFAGSWTPDMEKTMAANPNQPKAVPAARPMAIKQDLASFTIERLGASTGPQPIVYKLDGQPMPVTSSKTEGLAHVRAKWVGDTIVFETTQAQGAKAVSTVVYSRDGAWLVVTTTDPDPKGGTIVIKTYYRTTK